MKLDLVGENWMEKIGCSVCPFDFIKWHDRKDFMLYNFLIKFEEHCRETINTMTANGPITGLWFSLYIVVSSIFTFTYIKKIKHFVSEFRSVREAYSRDLSSPYNTFLLRHDSQFTAFSYSSSYDEACLFASPTVNFFQ